MVQKVVNKLPLTNEQLLVYRQRMEPLADEAVQQIYTEETIAAVHPLLAALTENDSVPSDKMPEPIKQYLERSRHLPAWADPDLIAKAGDIMGAAAPEMIVSLLYASLPETFADVDGARILGLTQNFAEHTVRRVYATGQLLCNVGLKGGLEPRGNGIVSAQKVRLLHGVIRHMVLDGSDHVPPSGVEKVADHTRRKPWNTTDYGAPVNQLDIVFTMLTFCCAMPKAMERFGLKLGTEERDAISHVFSILGYLLGADEALVPANAAEADALFAQMKTFKQGPSKEGKAMAAALEKILYRFIVDFDVAHDVHVFLMRTLNGDALADMLEVPHITRKTDFESKLSLGGFEIAARLARFFQAATEELPRELGSVAGFVGKRFLKDLLAPPNEWKLQRFALPVELTDRWDISA